MSAITIIPASLSPLALAILILAAIDDRKRFPGGGAPVLRAGQGTSSSAKPALRADAQRGLSFPAFTGHAAVGEHWMR